MNRSDWSVIRCVPGDLDRIQRLSEIIWKPTFESILPPDRLEYLYNWMYNAEKLTDQLNSNNIHFYILRCSGRDVGYAQLVFHEKWVKLEKLYIDPAMQGKGCGLYLLNHLVSQSVEKECNLVRLQVNRGNGNAIRFYQRFGFKIVASEDFDVGGGHVMDDYVMELDVRK